MIAASLEKALGQSKPFTLFLADGRKIPVAHPEFVWLVKPYKSVLVISHENRGGTELLRVNQIVSIHWSDHEAA